MILNDLVKMTLVSNLIRSLILFFEANRWIDFYLAPQPAVLQAEEKHVRNPVPKCPSKLLEPAIGRSLAKAAYRDILGLSYARAFPQLGVLPAVLLP